MSFDFLEHKKKRKERFRAFELWKERNDKSGVSVLERGDTLIQGGSRETNEAGINL